MNKAIIPIATSFICSPLLAYDGIQAQMVIREHNWAQVDDLRNFSLKLGSEWTNKGPQSAFVKVEYDWRGAKIVTKEGERSPALMGRSQPGEAFCGSFHYISPTIGKFWDRIHVRPLRGEWARDPEKEDLEYFNLGLIAMPDEWSTKADIVRISLEYVARLIVYTEKDQFSFYEQRFVIAGEPVGEEWKFTLTPDKPKPSSPQAEHKWFNMRE